MFRPTCRPSSGVSTQNYKYGLVTVSSVCYLLFVGFLLGAIFNPEDEGYMLL
jgi:hypothetical protein